MTGTEITLASGAAVFGLVATILTILTFFKNDKKEGKSDAKEIATLQSEINSLKKEKADAKDIVALSTDLTYIKEGITELKALIQAQSREQGEMKLKVQRIEDRVESIEAQIDTIENRNNGLLAKKGA